MEQLQAVLHDILDIEGVWQVCAVNARGEELYTCIRKGCTYLETAELFKRVKNFSSQEIKELFKKKEIKNVFLNITSAAVNIYFLSADLYVIIVSDEKTNFGKIRLVIRKNQEILEREG